MHNPVFPHKAAVTGVLTLLALGSHIALPRVSAQNTYQYQQLVKEITAVRQNNARRKADMQVLQENQRKLLAMLEERREKEEASSQQVAKLHQRVASLEARLQTLDASWRSEVNKLQKALNNEGKTRQKSIQELIKAVSEDFADAVKKVRVPIARSQKTYTVQAGDTLSAIAQAFEVTVADLKKTNSLNSDIIRPGQELTIPAN